jgi:hypothetical protein
MATLTLEARQTPSSRNTSRKAVSLPRNTTEIGTLDTPTARLVSKTILILSVLLSPFFALAQSVPGKSVESKDAPAWSINLTGGFASTFQMVLGSTFGPGQDVQDKLTVGVDNAFLKGDSVSAFGWSTTDLSNATPNWQAGLLYKLPILRRKNQNLSLTAGAQRWLLPLVKTGSKDWLATGNLTYGTFVKRTPVFISGDSYSLVKSNLPAGSALYSQIYTQHRLLHRNGLDLVLREGPAYAYSWGFYGCNGNRDFRYGGSLISSWKGTSLEATYRRQVALQDKIPDNGYWSFLFSRQLTGAFRHK